MINSKTVLAITLARGGSERIPLKNIIPICGKPLISYTIEETLKSKYIDDYVVSTDHLDIKEVVKFYKKAHLLNRPVDLGGSKVSSADVILNVLDRVLVYDYVVEIMATNPLKTVEDIDGAIKKLVDTDANAVVSVVRIWDHHPSRVKYIENDILKDFYPEVLESRRQDLNPPAYVRNGSIYAMKYESFLKYKTRVMPETRPYIMPEERTINIDEPMDLKIAEQLLKGKV